MSLSKRKERGQSLVEMAVIIPLLLMIFLALIEIGWAIRGYMVLLTQTREATRFGVRADVAKEHTLQGDYLPILDHFNEIVQHQPNFYPIYGGQDTNASLYVFRLDVSITDPCGMPQGTVIGPSQLMTYTVTFGKERPAPVFLEDPDYQGALIATHAELMCQQSGRDATADTDRVHSLLRLDTWYDQPQLLRFPLFDWAGAIPLHTNATMRLQ